MGSKAAVWVLAAACLAVIAYNAHFTWKYFSITPFWDIWNWVSDYQAYVEHRYTLHDLIKPHNEHRIATTRLVLFVDAIWFHMTGRFAVACNFIVLLFLGFVIGIAASGGRKQWHRGVLAVLFSMAWMTSACQWPNLIQPFQVQFAFLCLSVVSASVLLVKATSAAHSARMASAWATGAAICFLAGVFSMAGGVLALLPLMGLVVLRRQQPAAAMLFVTFALAAVGGFLYDYHPVTAGGLTLGMAVSTLVGLLEFASGFLGSAFYALGSAAFYIGAAGLALFGIAMIHILDLTWRCRVGLAWRPVALLAVASTVVLIAAAAAVSRLGFGLALALAPRYATMSLLFWGCLVPLLVQLYLRADRSSHAHFAAFSPLGALPLAAALAVSSLCPRFVTEVRAFDGAMASQAVSMRQNVFVPRLFNAMIYGDASQWTAQIGFLHSQHLSVFADDDSFTPPGALVKAAEAGDALPHCLGGVDYAGRVDATRLAIRMWLGSPKAKRSANWIAFVTPTHDVVAVVPATEYRGSIRVDHSKIHAILGVDTGISDPMAAADGDIVLHAIGWFSGDPNLTCMFRQSLAIGPLYVRPMASVRPRPLAGAGPAPVLQGAFSVDGVTSMAHLVVPYPLATIVASGAAGDAAIGQAIFSVHAANADLVVPVATGPSPAGQSLEAIFADKVRRNLALPPEAQDGAWRAVVVPSSYAIAHGGLVTIVVTDAGTGWGQWMAVAPPVVASFDPAWAKLY